MEQLYPINIRGQIHPVHLQLVPPLSKIWALPELCKLLVCSYTLVTAMTLYRLGFEAQNTIPARLLEPA